jgi:hypothetical protein
LVVLLGEGGGGFGEELVEGVPDGGGVAGTVGGEPCGGGAVGAEFGVGYFVVDEVFEFAQLGVGEPCGEGCADAVFEFGVDGLGEGVEGVDGQVLRVAVFGGRGVSGGDDAGFLPRGLDLASSAASG